jgi:hypothetical protein
VRESSTQHAVFLGTGWARAAEIIRHTAPAGLWPERNVSAFARMLTEIYLPWVNEGASTNGNIALVMSETFLHIGVFTDNRTIVDAAVALYRCGAENSIMISTSLLFVLSLPWQNHHCSDKES